MKIALYMDVFPGTTRDSYFWATSTPSGKPEGVTRYRIDVEIPDPALPDVVRDAIPVPVTEEKSAP